MKSEKFFVIVGFILISIIWGSTWLAIKIGLESVPPLYGVAIRFTLAVAILLIIMRFRGERFPVDKDSLALFLTMGVLSISLPFALVYWGEQYISSGLASVLFAVYPFVVATYSHFMLPGEKLNPYKIIGIAFGFIGILIIFWTDIRLGDASTLGMAAVLVSTLLQGMALVIIKKKGNHISPTTLNAGGMLVGVVILYLMALAFEKFSDIRFDEKGIGSILYLGTFGSVITFVTYYWLLKRVEAVYLSLVSFVTPILAVILGTVFLNEVLEPNVFSGATLVMLGILVANGKDIMKMIPDKKVVSLFSNEEENL
jgi:drug/metabolite transporter (DMT)-like permease